MAGDWFVWALLIQYACASLAYLMGGQGYKALYWAGAFVISLAVLRM